MSRKGDLKKVLKEAEAAGGRVVEKKEYFLVYGPMPESTDRSDPRYQPCRIGHTPSSQASWRNFLKCLERKGLR